MKKSLLTALAVIALCGNVVFAIAPTQDKPMSKTTTTSTSKKSMPMATKSTTTKTVHTKHTKQS